MGKAKFTVQVATVPSRPMQSIALEEGSTVGDLLIKLKLLREEHIVLVDDQVVTEYERLHDGDRLHLIRAFSGG